MSRTPRVAFAGAAILFFAVAAWSAGPAEEGTTRIWAMNVGSERLEMSVERSRDGLSERETLAVGAGEMIEVPRAGGEQVGIPDHRDLLVVTASAAFDASAIRVDQVNQRSRAAARPAAGRGQGAEREVAAERGPARTRLRRGEKSAAALLWAGSEPRTVGLRLHGTKGWAEVRLTKPDGALLAYVTLGASRALDVTIDFAPTLDAQGYWGVVNREIKVYRGEVSIPQTTARPEAGRRERVAVVKSNGDGHFNYNRNWQNTPDLRYYVENGPASTCGELNAYRSSPSDPGTWYFTSNWLCTNSTGYAEKGPWDWSSQGDDETAEVFIRWPNNTATSSDWHIWDKRCPNTPSIESSPPNSWSGFASDPPFGSCLGDWSSVYAIFYDKTAQRWATGTGGYSNFVEYKVYVSYSGLPTCSATWSTPFPTSHTSGHEYEWKVCVIENASQSNCEVCSSPYTFTY